MAYEHGTRSEAGATGRIGDRRAHARTEAALRCKVLVEGSGAYLPGRTMDVSAGGVLVELRTTRALRVGALVEVAVSWDDAALLRREGARSGRVVRAEALTGGRQVVGLAYEARSGLGEIVVRGSALPERRSAA